MFHVYTNTINPDCGFNISGYISKYSDPPVTYHFTNLNELAYASLDYFEGSLKIYKHKDEKAEVFRGKNELKQMKEYVKNLKDGTYDLIFIRGDLISEKMTIKIDRNSTCKDLKSINTNFSTDNLLFGKVPKYTLKTPTNKNSLDINPVYSDRDIRGIGITLNHSLPFTRYFSIGLGFRNFTGNNQLGEFYIPSYQRLEAQVRFWPSMYNGIYMNTGAYYYTSNDFAHFVGLGLQGRVSRFAAINFGIRLNQTTIENYNTPYYSSFYFGFSILYNNKNEKHFIQDYRNNKKEYKKFKKRTENMGF